MIKNVWNRPFVLGAASVFLASLCLWAGALHAQEWTRFRGPNGTGISDAKGIPATWTEKDIRWKVKLPGIGHAQPVFWDEKIFVSSSNDSERLLSCHSTRDGSVVWVKKFSSGKYRTHNLNNFASSTPAVDEERVYAAISHPDNVALIAFSHAGKEVWRYDLGEFKGQHGFGTSPMVSGELVIISNEIAPKGGSSEGCYVVALDRKTGKERWKTPRRNGGKAAYGTPCLYTDANGAQQFLFTSLAHGIYALDVKTGDPLWDANVFDKRSVSSPVVADGVILGSCGSGGGGNFVVAVRPGGSGDVKDTHVAYSVRSSAPYVPTPLAKNGRVYLWSDKGGIVTCIEAKSGKVVWRERIGGTYYSSPIWVDGKIFCVSTDGEVVVIRGDSDELEILGRNQLGETCHTAPAVAGGLLYLRTESHLYAIGGAKVARD